MALSIKTKIASGIGVLFGLLLLTSCVALLAINLLSNKTENLLTANYNTIRYCNQMMHAMDRLPNQPSALLDFDSSLRAQEKNITEPGEGIATASLRRNFDKLRAGIEVNASLDSINNGLYSISQMNQHALEQKNRLALTTAGNAKLWLSILTTLVILVGFSLAFNLPGIVTTPLKQITNGIREIAKKNYRTRILISNTDEFGEMATAFNRMAERLDEWEGSSMAQIMFEKTRVDSIINQMEDAVLGLDANDRILFLNRAAANLFHLNAMEISGKEAQQVAKGNDLLQAVLKKEIQGPLKIIVDGKEEFFTLNYKKVEIDEKDLGEVFTLKNITHFKELDLSKTNLLATISHELKTPISSIKMSSRLLEDERIGKLNVEQHEMVTNIRDDAERLLRLTGELLNMTQLETGNIQLKIQQVPAGQIIHEALQAVQVQAQQRSISIVQELEPGLPDLHADADKTALVLVNLLTNAIKYSNEASTIHLSVNHKGHSVQFGVKDEGQGIEAKYLSKIFDRYFKVPGSINKTGTGLGLAISKEFIEAQGGAIGVESVAGKGSFFYFSIPAI